MGYRRGLQKAFLKENPYLWTLHLPGDKIPHLLLNFLSPHCLSCDPRTLKPAVSDAPAFRLSSS